jgi:hypothetical protein
MAEQKKAEEFGITEDDVSEIRQDINKFRSVSTPFLGNFPLVFKNFSETYRVYTVASKKCKIVGLLEIFFIPCDLTSCEEKIRTK